MWRTFDGCIDLKLSIKDNKIYADIDLYNGDSYRGFRKSLKWSAKFEISQYHLKYFIKNINWKFDDYLEDLYEKEQELKKQQRKLQFEKELLFQPNIR